MDDIQGSEKVAEEVVKVLAEGSYSQALNFT